MTKNYSDQKLFFNSKTVNVKVEICHGSFVEQEQGSQITCLLSLICNSTFYVRIQKK